MESSQLLSFYEAISSWPKSEAGFGAVVERICRLGGFSLVALAFRDPFSQEGEHGRLKVIYRLAGQHLPSARAGGDMMEEVLRRQVRQAEETRLREPDSEKGQMELARFSLSPESSPGAAAPAGIHSMTLVSVSDDVGVEEDIRPFSPRPPLGWLIVGSERSLSPEEETLLLAVAQRLSELARISRLEGVLDLRSQFLSIASHELKTPLTSIYGILQLQERMSRLKRSESKGTEATEAQEQKRSYLKILLRQVERLNELIDGLLDLSRIQNGRFVVEPSDTDVAALLRDIVQSRLNVIADEAGVKLHVDAPDSLMVWVDPVRMEEVITNIVMNAIRFSPEGGVIWIRLREDGPSFRLTVRDQGPSVPPEDRERIFKPFERAQRTSRLGGLGLGLFISRQIALLHGGNVSLVESVPGKGNVIEAYFPIRNITVISA